MNGVEFMAGVVATGRIHSLPEPPGLELLRQGGHLEYRAAGTKVSVLVVDDQEEGCACCPRYGDVWSVSLG